MREKSDEKNMNAVNAKVSCTEKAEPPVNAARKDKKYKRVFLIVLDSFGIGASHDAHLYGDEGANTLLSAHKSGRLSIPNLSALGLGSVEGVECLDKPSPIGAYGRLSEVSAGKDTTTGHWEMCGVVSEKPLPTFPEGFPREITQAFSKAVGRGVLCNKPYSGTAVINDFGEEHIKTGSLIIYTSADSVFQIAAHTDVVPVPELYRICEVARDLLVGDSGVGRVIARPFAGDVGSFYRTSDRRDFSLPPPKPTLTDILTKEGFEVRGVGKISDIFAGRGISESYPTHSNREGMEKTLELLNEDFCGLAFVNLVDFDMLYGHRQDAGGYADALTEFDSHLSTLLNKLKDDDALIITADHGCDPSDSHTDHTREYVPFLIYGKGIKPENFGTGEGFYNVGAMVYRLLSTGDGFPYKTDFYEKIT